MEGGGEEGSVEEGKEEERRTYVEGRREGRVEGGGEEGRVRSERDGGGEESDSSTSGVSCEGGEGGGEGGGCGGDGVGDTDPTLSDDESGMESDENWSPDMEPGQDTGNSVPGTDNMSAKNDKSSSGCGSGRSFSVGVKDPHIHIASGHSLELTVRVRGR